MSSASQANHRRATIVSQYLIFASEMLVVVFLSQVAIAVFSILHAFFTALTGRSPSTMFAALRPAIPDFRCASETKDQANSHIADEAATQPMTAFPF